MPEGSKLVCMDCQAVSLCYKPECVDSTFTPFGAVDPRERHLPNHGVFKVRRHIFLRDKAGIQALAKSVLKYRRLDISSLKEKGKSMPECVRCKTTVLVPCWSCLDCPGE